jgi:hypothetical protein
MKRAGDLGDERFERLVPAVFLRVEPAVAGDDPSDVARSMRPKHDGRRILPGLAQQRLDRMHGADEPSLRRSRAAERAARDLVVRCTIERRERLATGRRQLQLVPPRIARRGDFRT